MAGKVRHFCVSVSVLCQISALSVVTVLEAGTVLLSTFALTLRTVAKVVES
jgi:hypothetical protein